MVASDGERFAQFPQQVQGIRLVPAAVPAKPDDLDLPPHELPAAGDVLTSGNELFEDGNAMSHHCLCSPKGRTAPRRRQAPAIVSPRRCRLPAFEDMAARIAAAFRPIVPAPYACAWDDENEKLAELLRAATGTNLS
ncbi:hypothetical protein [Cupriavidus pauculus]|uniref:hypothetical protein n=1 Tax=Cupriavidus pauculus TaxID=82633 RepID=UPI0011AF08F7|nr:hypothetical protein [Cupriavidus pauculus]